MFPTPPPPVLSEALAAEIDRWIDLAHGAWGAWFVVGRQGATMPRPDSPVALEDAALVDAHADWDPGQAIDAGVQAARLVDAAGQHLLGVAALYQARQVILAPWPVVRAELEHLSRAAWILAPDVTPEQRVARCWLERLFAAYQHRLTVSGLRTPGSQQKAARRMREEVREEIERRFPGSSTEVPDAANEDPNWLVGGERLASLGQTMGAFTRQELDVPRLYDALSYVAHPAVFELAAVAPPVEVDGHIEFPYQVKPESVIQLIALAAVALYRGAWACCSYFDYDGNVLEGWADAAAAIAPDIFKPAGDT